MKLYTFVAGGYISKKQCGIQSAHVLGEMISSFGTRSIEFNKIIEWSSDHKTIVVLNAFDSYGVDSAYKSLVEYASDLNLPVTKFYESENSLGGALTACGVIASKNISDAVKNYLIDGYTLEGSIIENQLNGSEEAIFRIIIKYKTV